MKPVFETITILMILLVLTLLSRLNGDYNYDDAGMGYPPPPAGCYPYDAANNMHRGSVKPTVGNFAYPDSIVLHKAVTRPLIAGK